MGEARRRKIYEEETKKVTKQDYAVCPICGGASRFRYRVRPLNYDKFITYWRCSCPRSEGGGCLFRSSNSGEEFIDTNPYERSPRQTQKFRYLVKVYFPLIEELTLGRKMLEIGYYMPFVMREARDRGWIVTGLDLKPLKKNERDIQILQGEFLQYDFGVRKFDLIWMNHLIEHIENWWQVLMKIHELLRPEGVAFISSPDASLLDETGIEEFAWGDASHRILFHRLTFAEQMKIFKFNQILLLGNKSARYPGWFDFHGIWQKSYYDEPYIGGYDRGIDFQELFDKVQEKGVRDEKF